MSAFIIGCIVAAILALCGCIYRMGYVDGRSSEQFEYSMKLLDRLNERMSDK